MKKMNISNLTSFCKRHNFTLELLEDGYPNIKCNDRFGMIAKYSENGRFWDFKPYGPPNDLDQFIDAYTELNGEWY